MKLDEMLAVACPRQVAREILIGAAEPINQHLVKLVGFPFPEELRQPFRKELRSWLNRVQRMRLKPDARTGSFKFYFEPLFDYPFGGIEVPNMRALMAFISSELATPGRAGRPRKWPCG